MRYISIIFRKNYLLVLGHVFLLAATYVCCIGAMRYALSYTNLTAIQKVIIFQTASFIALLSYFLLALPKVFQWSDLHSDISTPPRRIIQKVFYTILLSACTTVVAKSLIETPSSYSEELANSSRFLVFLSVVILAPIFEETIFRWGVFKLIDKHIHRELSVILSSLVFSIFHGSIVQGIAVFGLAYSLNYIYSRNHNLLTCIIIHMCINFFGFWTLFDNNSHTEKPLVLFLSQYNFIAIASASIIAYFSYRGLKKSI